MLLNLSIKLIIREIRSGYLTSMLVSLTLAITIVSGISLFTDRLEKALDTQTEEFLGGNLKFESNTKKIEPLLKKLDIDMQIIRHGKFKSAIEPFTRKNMSEENKKQTKSYMNDLWNNMLMEISVSRNINFKDLNKYSENYTLQSSYDAKKMMLIDSNIYKDQIINIFKIKTNDTNNLNLIKISKYINHNRQDIKKEYKNRFDEFEELE